MTSQDLPESDTGQSACSDSRVAQWLFTMICWDGMLPGLVALTPLIVGNLAARWPLIQIMVGVFLPIAAFGLRRRLGFGQLADGRHARWQIGLFFPALFLLMIFDALFAVFTMIPQGLRDDDWQIVWWIFATYLVLIAIAMFPLRRTG